MRLKQKRSTVCVIRVLEGAKKEGRAKKVLINIRAENFPNLSKDINLQNQKAKSIPNRTNLKKFMPKHITVKVLKMEDGKS